MEAKTESKIVLSVLLLGPLSAGILMLTNNSWGLFPYLLLLIALFGYLYLWVPRRWFGGEQQAHSQSHRQNNTKKKKKRR